MKFILVGFIVLKSILSFGQLPVNFPDKWRNKVICGNASAQGKMLDGSQVWTDIPFKLTISDEGVFAEYNGGEKWGNDEWGKTQTVSSFEVKSKDPLYMDNKLYGYKINYTVPNAYRNSSGTVDTKHSIIEIWLETYTDPKKTNVLGVKIIYGSYTTTISSNHVVYNICN